MKCNKCGLKEFIVIKKEEYKEDLSKIIETRKCSNCGEEQKEIVDILI